MRVYNKSLGKKPILTTPTTQYYQGGYIMNELQLAFNYETLPVRTITDGVTIWFALIDVCKIFDLSNPRMVAKRLDEDEVRKFNLRSLEGDTWFITESGLYTVIIRSRSDKAKPFRRWVTHEVLPSIRKQGYYSALPDDELLSLLTQRLKEKPNLMRDVTISKRNDEWYQKLCLDEELRELWGKRFELSADEYNTELATICNHQLARYNQEWRKYAKWLHLYRKAQAESEMLR